MITQRLESKLSELPTDYAERVYAGVLGKVIGVYLGRPIENWRYEDIQRTFGDVAYYIHEKRDRRLIVTDDDISGTFTFLRAVQDFDYPNLVEPWMVGETWMNYLIERKTTLWWGGLGNSTEHTAFLRMKQGAMPPKSGSCAMNGKVVSEQIGGQIFIDGWGLLCPGDPNGAADYARVAACVSHDGEAIYGAQVVAAMVALAFEERDVERLVRRSLEVIPEDCEIRRVADFVLHDFRAGVPWRAARARLDHSFGYAHYAGACPIIPNHGLVLLAILHSRGSFDEGMKIVNTSGWDTDCNSGNVGCVLGVLGGLDAFNAQNWRGPVADKVLIPSADPGRCISDALRESYEVVNMARRLRGLAPLAPKGGARFHFSLPGSVQGFETPTASASLSNSGGALDLTFRLKAEAGTWTFIPPGHIDFVSGYQLIGSPTLYASQRLRARVAASASNSAAVSANLYVARYHENDTLERMRGERVSLQPGESREIEWTVPDCDGYPVAEVGLETSSTLDEDHTVTLEWLDWDGTPNVTLRPRRGRMWGRAWAPCLDRFQHERDGYGHLVQDEGRGLLIQGGSEWTRYRFEAHATPHLAHQIGIAAAVQGLRRYYALVLSEDGRLRLIKQLYGETTLCETVAPFELYRGYDFALELDGPHLRGYLDGALVLETTDNDRPLLHGAVGLLVESGAMGVEDEVRVSPLANP